MEPLPLLWAVLGATLISLVAWLLRSLSTGGAIAAMLLGTLVMAAGGWVFLPPLLTAFITCSLLSKLPPRRQGPDGSRRTVTQVIANGGVAGGAVIWHALSGDPLAYLAYTTAWCALAADTWATEIGGRWGGRPRLLLVGPPVANGTSGGVTLIGLLASLAGAAAVATSAWAWLNWQLIILCSLAGLAGSIVDSLLGARWQVRWRCPACGTISEDRHHCNQRGERAHGWPWLTNDVVNILGIAAAVTVALLTAWVWRT